MGDVSILPSVVTGAFTLAAGGGIFALAGRRERASRDRADLREVCGQVVVLCGKLERASDRRTKAQAATNAALSEAQTAADKEPDVKPQSLIDDARAQLEAFRVVSQEVMDAGFAIIDCLHLLSLRMEDDDPLGEAARELTAAVMSQVRAATEIDPENERAAQGPDAVSTAREKLVRGVRDRLGTVPVS